MGKIFKIMTGLCCAMDIAGGIVVGQVVEKKTYEYTGNAVMATLAGSTVGTAVGVTALNATLNLANVSNAKQNGAKLEAENRKLKRKYDDLSKMHDELMDRNTNLMYKISDMQKEYNELEEENQRLKGDE